MNSVMLETTDPAEVERVLNTNLAGMRLTVGQRAPTPFRLTRTLVGTMALDSAEYGAGFRFTMEPPENILLCRVIAGGIEHHEANRPDARIAPGHAGVIGATGPHGGAVSGRVHQGRIDHLIVDPRLLNQIAAPPPGFDGVVRLTGTSPISAAASRFLAATVEYVKCFAAQGEAERNPLLTAALEHHVATVLLATLPNTSLMEPTIEDRHDATPVALHRAMSFIDDNAHRDVALSDIASAIYVTPRTLQYMFRKHHDCTPMEYLRRVRLHYVRRDLTGATRGETTVAQIARRWGFGHLGRFAVYYREQYGESPHETLRR